MKTSQEMKTNLTPKIQNPFKIRDTIIRTIIHVMTDINLIKHITDIKNDTYLESYREL